MRLLLSLVPWMAVGTAAAFQAGGPRPAEAVLEFAAGKRLAASRVADECYVTASALESAGVTCTFDSLQATVFAFGRSARVTYRLQAKNKVVPLGEVAKQLGGRGLWFSDGAFHVIASVKRVTFIDGVLSVYAGLPYSTRLRVEQDPPRLVVSLEGCELDAQASRAADAPWQVKSTGASTMEVSLPIAPGFTIAVVDIPARPTLTLKLSDVLAQARQTTSRQNPKPRTPEAPAKGTSQTGPTQPPKTVGEGSGAQAETQMPPPIPEAQAESEPWDLQPTRWNGPSIVRLGRIELASKTANGAVLVIKGDRDFAANPSIRRLSDLELEVVLPNATLAGEPRNPAPGFVQTVDSRVTEEGLILKLKLLSPCGVQFGVPPGEVHLALVVRRGGDVGLAGKTIVVDAGHGGHDTGARSPDKKVNEKDLTLSVAKKVADRLVQEGAMVIMTRKTDDFETLRERPEIANRCSAEAFVSVHINSSPRPNSRSGGITFYHAKDPAGILLAECVQSEIALVSGIPNLGTWSDLRLFETGLAVLRYAKVPAVLIELGFINHAKDRAKLVTKEFQDAAAGAIVRGLKVYLGHGQD
ncbi:MAG: N-acetylmuramoyl-L-alanine amidase [Armatimonadetes bacterium]|nr:N-acetylmuramoyl-L-alanine amidase [Armatimonadota bacterium]